MWPFWMWVMFLTLGMSSFVLGVDHLLKTLSKKKARQENIADEGSCSG